MPINLSVISMNENKILFSGHADMEEEICLENFLFKVTMGHKIILSENDKKIIVYFNEIFTLNYFEYIIIDTENLLNLITYFPGSHKNFEYLIQQNFRTFLFNFLKIIFHCCDLLCFQKIFLFIIVFLFIFSEKKLSQDKLLNQEEFLTQKNIYLILNQISMEAKPETVLFMDPMATPVGAPRDDKVTTSEGEKKKTVTPREGRKNKKLEVIDSEIQYFMQLKNK